MTGQMFLRALLGLALAGCTAAISLRSARGPTSDQLKRAYMLKTELDEQDLTRLLSEVYPPDAWDPRKAPIGATDQAQIDSADGGEHTACSKGPATYGEVSPAGHLKLLRAVGAKPGEVYYDLGAGLGKGALVAWTLGLSARGVELSAEIYAYSCKRIAVLTEGAARRSARSLVRPPASGGELTLTHGNVLDYDFSDANVVFLDNKCWPASMMASLTEMFARMPRGTRIISAIDLIMGPDARMHRVQTVPVPVTWGKPGYRYPFQVYVVDGKASQALVQDTNRSSHHARNTTFENCSLRRDAI